MLEPPEFLNEAQRASWDRVIAGAPRELRQGVDETLLLSWVVAEEQYRTAASMQAQIDTGSALPMLSKDKNGNPVASPYLGIMARASAQMMKAAQALGFKPGDRRVAMSGDAGDAFDGSTLVSKRELCTILRISRPTLDNWLDRNDDFPVVERGGNGKEWQFDAAAVVAYLRDKKDQEQRDAAERAERLQQFALPIDDIAAAPDAASLTPQERVQYARARQIERELARDSGLLVPTADVRQALQTAIRQLADHFDSVVHQVAREEQWPPATLRKVQGKMHEGRTAFISRLRDYSPDATGGVEPQAAEPALL